MIGKTARRALLAPAVLLALVCACDTTVDTSDDARKLAAKLSSSSGRANAEQKLGAAPARLVQDPVAQVVADASAPADARIAAIRIVSDNVAHDLILAEQVVDAFADPQTPESVRLASLEAMVRAGDPEFFDVLTRATADADPLHAKVAEVMPRYAENRRRWYKTEMMLARTSAAQMIATRALGDVGTQDDIPAIESAMETGPPQVKYEALLTLAKLGGPKASDICLKHLQDEDPFIRAAAISAVQTFKDTRAIPALEKTLREDGVADNRVSAAQALAVIGGKDARLALTKGCGSQPTNPIRQACSTALKRVR